MRRATEVAIIGSALLHLVSTRHSLPQAPVDRVMEGEGKRNERMDTDRWGGGVNAESQKDAEAKRQGGGSGVNTFENQTLEPNRAKVTLVFNPCFFSLICTPGT